MTKPPTIKPKQFPYHIRDQRLGDASSLPYLPLTLLNGSHSVTVQGMLDTGATVNVLPYELGLQLGAIWEDQSTSIKLTGNLANFEAKALVLSAQIANFEPVRLAFAWSQASHIPIILGQVNFFLSFEVCFYRAQSVFEIRPVAT